MLLNYLLATTLPDWVTTLIPFLQTIFIISLVILSVIIIVLVLAQESTQGGTNVLSGATESFYAQNKGSSREGRLKKIMMFAGIAFFVIVVLYFVSLQIYNA